MIKNLAEHGLVPSDLSTGLLNDAKRALARLEAQQEQRQRAEQEALDNGLPVSLSSEHLTANDTDPSDVRYTILSHLFILSIADGSYDARARTILRTIASDMEVPYLDLVKLETVIADQLRLFEDHDDVKPDDDVVGQRNKFDGRNRWLLAGIATLAGGAVIGVTAGLAAPFIGAGIGAALTTFGVTGATGVSTFMASAGGLAMITTGGVLTGGGMSGAKMMKRTRGIEEFEFLGLEDALKRLEENREKRRTERRKRYRREARAQQQEKQAQAAQQAAHAVKADGKQLAGGGLGMPDGASPLPPVPMRPAGVMLTSAAETHGAAGANDSDVLWEMASTVDTDLGHDQEDMGYDDDDDDLASTVNGDMAQNDGMDDDGIRFREPSELPKARQTHVLVTIAGWVARGEDDHTLPFSVLEVGQNGDQHTLIWETKVLQELGSTLSILFGEIASFIFQQGLQATLLPVLMAGLAGPMWMIKLTYLVDNPWGNALTKAEKAGRVLADTLMGQVQGNRPVTLVGFSLGARVIYFCLLELAAHNATGLVEEAYIFGTPVIGKKADWERIASIVAGRVVNGYTQNDMMLGVLYRASSALWSEVAGLGPISDVPGIHNENLSDIVKGHLDYRTEMPKILKRCGFAVSSDSFEDWDQEEERERLELEKERLHEREERMRKRKEEAEQKRKEREEAAAAKKKAALDASATGSPASSWFGSRATSAMPSPALGTVSAAGAAVAGGVAAASIAPITKSPLTKEQLVEDELRQMAELEDLMHVYWQPREIVSTMPKLVIKPTESSGASGSAPQPTQKETAKTDSAAAPAKSPVPTTPASNIKSGSSSEEDLVMDMLQDQMNEMGVFDGVGNNVDSATDILGKRSSTTAPTAPTPVASALRMPGAARTSVGPPGSPSGGAGLQPPQRAFASRR
ncbi:hypothetical protein BC831DRAFT_152325 [Entophlyctis helioformis]|nr:hypothetical protein BC831DRAFT_152325 [Entophlyctis helioformis]